MSKIHFTEHYISFSKYFFFCFVPFIGVKIGKEEFNFSFSRFFGIWPMCTVPSVCQTITSTNWTRFLVYGAEYFCWSQKLTPHRYSIMSCKNVRSYRSTCHITDQPIVEESAFMFSIELTSPFSCHMYHIRLNVQKLVSQNNVSYVFCGVWLSNNVRLQDG